MSFKTKQFYTQGRQTMLNRCINEACGNPNRISGMYRYTIKHIIWVEKISGAMIICNWNFQSIEGTVNATLNAQLHNMLHYDVMSWWQLKIQVRFQWLTCLTMQHSILKVPGNNWADVLRNKCTGYYYIICILLYWVIL